MIDPGGGPSRISESTLENDGARNPARVSLRGSLVVCAYTEERWPQICKALGSIAVQTVPPWQVIVVVDHNPALHKRLEEKYPDVDVIANRFERGLSGGRNTGILRAHGDIVVFLDDDARAEPDWLEILLASYDDESVLGVGGLVRADWGSAYKPSWMPDEFLWVVGCSYEGLPDVKAEVRNPVGANMSFRRSAFERAGLFDSSVGRNTAVSRPLGCEETEFSIRLLRISPNGRIIHEPKAVVHHHVDRVRSTWRYFLHRCYAEGYSKELVARLSGMSAALSSERRYVAKTIRRAAQRELVMLFRRGRRDAAGRIAALILGVSSASAGYMRAMVAGKLSLRRVR
jgi:GT2 family glycosyltransferase